MHVIITCSCILAIHKVRIFLKNVLKNKEMIFKNGVKYIQAAAYNSALTLCKPKIDTPQPKSC